MSDGAVRGRKSRTRWRRRVEKYIPPTSWAAGNQSEVCTYCVNGD